MRSLITASALLLCGTAHASIGWQECQSCFASGYYPAGPQNAVAICREGDLAISYDKNMVNPAHSSYFLDHTKEEHLISGRDTFYEDPDLQKLRITQGGTHSHAYNYSWNKGHLAPSHAMSWTSTAKHSCYTMANVAPQAATFNQKPWEQLEASVIDWVTKHSRSVYVITGIGYKNRASARRTWDNIAVPDYYWKVLCDPIAQKSAGWWGPNEADNTHTVSDAMSVQDIQENYFGALEGRAADDNSALFPSQCNPGQVDASYWSGIGAYRYEETKNVEAGLAKMIKKLASNKN